MFLKCFRSFREILQSFCKFFGVFGRFGEVLGIFVGLQAVLVFGQGARSFGLAAMAAHRHELREPRSEPWEPRREPKEPKEPKVPFHRRTCDLALTGEETAREVPWKDPWARGGAIRLGPRPRRSFGLWSLAPHGSLAALRASQRARGFGSSF